jgi:hypothetical protein
VRHLPLVQLIVYLERKAAPRGRFFASEGVHRFESDRVNHAAFKGVLESYSSRLLPCVQWEATPKNNVKVLNDTGDFYRFFDATPHAGIPLRMRAADDRAGPCRTRRTSFAISMRSGPEWIAQCAMERRRLIFRWLSLSQTQSGWRLIENWAMLLPDVGFVQTDLWNGDGPAAVASSA